MRILVAEDDKAVLDITMPGRDGVSVTRSARAAGCLAPVLLATARGEVRDKVSGLDAGADAYIVKPYSTEELLARLRALQRRARPELDPVLRIADLEIDLRGRVARRAGQEIVLTNREFSLLEVLAEASPRAVSKATLVERAAPQLPPDFSEEVQEEIQRLSQLVERSLLTAKAEGGKLEINTAPVDLSGLLADLHEDYVLLAGEGAITLVWRIAPGLVVSSDPELLRQILHNLIGNAMRHGRNRVRVRATRSRTGDQIIVRFTNFISTGNSAQIGTGMGLRLVRSLSHALGRTRFVIRKTDQIFSARLVLPTIKPDTFPS